MLTDKEMEQLHEEMIEKMIENFLEPDNKECSPIKYIGGKYFIARDIIKLFPYHDCYVEPFFGAGHVFFQKQPSLIEVINDIDNNIINFFKVLQDKQTYKKFLHLMITTPVSRIIYKDLKEKFINNQFSDSVEKAFMFFYLLVNGFSGRLGVFGYSCDKNLAFNYINRINKIIFAHQRLFNAVIENLDAVEIIKKYDSKKTLFYLDPPYVHSTRKNDKDYIHEMEDEKHEELIETVLSSKGMFVISNYDNEIYQKLENYGYKKIFIDVFCHSSYKTNERFNLVRPRRQETIWFNVSAEQTFLF